MKDKKKPQSKAASRWDKKTVAQIEALLSPGVVDFSLLKELTGVIATGAVEYCDLIAFPLGKFIIKAEMSHIDFSAAKWDPVVGIGRSSLSNCRFVGASIQSQISSNHIDCDFSKCKFRSCGFSPKTRFENCRFDNAKFTGCTLYSCHFVNCSFVKSSISTTEFDECVFDNCDFTNTSFYDNSMGGCLIQNSPHNIEFLVPSTQERIMGIFDQSLPVVDFGKTNMTNAVFGTNSTSKIIDAKND